MLIDNRQPSSIVSWRCCYPRWATLHLSSRNARSVFQHIYLIICSRNHCSRQGNFIFSEANFRISMVPFSKRVHALQCCMAHHFLKCWPVAVWRMASQQKQQFYGRFPATGSPADRCLLCSWHIMGTGSPVDLCFLCFGYFFATWSLADEFFGNQNWRKVMESYKFYSRNDGNHGQSLEIHKNSKDIIGNALESWTNTRKSTRSNRKS